MSLLEIDLPSLLVHDDRPVARRVIGAIVDAAVVVWRTTGRRGPVRFVFDGQTLEGQGGPPHYRCTDLHWMDAVSFALMLRRADAISEALAFPVELLNAASNLESDEVRFAQFHATRGLLAGEPDVVGGRIARAKLLADPSVALFRGPRLARRTLAELTMLEAIAQRDQENFTEAAVRGLAAHALRYARGLARSSEHSYFPFRIIGLAALAVDRGLSWEIECAYTPRWLVEGAVP